MGVAGFGRPVNNINAVKNVTYKKGLRGCALSFRFAKILSSGPKKRQITNKSQK